MGFEDAQGEGNGGRDGAEGYFVVFSDVCKDVNCASAELRYRLTDNENVLRERESA